MKKKLFAFLVLTSVLCFSDQKMPLMKVFDYMKNCRQGDAEACAKKNSIQAYNVLAEKCNDRGVFGKQSQESKQACKQASDLIDSSGDIKTAHFDEDEKPVQMAIPDKKIRKPAEEIPENDQDADCDNCG